MKQAVIFCGGYGKRLGAITKKIPKPLIKIKGKPFIENIIKQYSRHNVKNILLLCSYKSNLFKKKYHNKIILGCKIKCFIEKNPSGTAGALRNAKKYIDKEFYLSNGDTLTNFNILLLKKYLTKGSLISMAILKKNNSDKKYSGFKIDENNFLSFTNTNAKYINTGYCLVKKKLIDKIKTNHKNFENDFLKIQKKKIIKGLVLNKKHNFFLDIGRPKDLNSTRKFLERFDLKKAVFLDRDGVINRDYGYVHKYNQIKYINNIIKAIKLLNDNNFYVFVITNQSGVGRGYYSERDVENLHNLINLDLNKNFAHIDEFVFAPYYENSKIKFRKKDKLMRKPNIGMIEHLFDNWNIDKKKSLIIGDKESDKQLSIKCKIKYLSANNNIDLFIKLKKKFQL